VAIVVAFGASFDGGTVTVFVDDVANQLDHVTFSAFPTGNATLTVVNTSNGQTNTFSSSKLQSTTLSLTNRHIAVVSGTNDSGLTWWALVGLVWWISFWEG
jgi:hypothetical protein